MNIQDSLEITQYIKDNRGDYTWQELTDIVNEKFSTDLSKDSVRARFRRELKALDQINIESVDSEKEFETHYANGEVILNKKAYFRKGEKKTPESILKSLGYDPEEVELAEWRIGTWQVAMKDNDGNPTKTECCTIRAKIKPKIKDKLTKVDLEEISERLKDIKPLELSILKYIKGLNKNKVTLFSIADFHFGSYSNSVDSGFNYNLKIQKGLFEALIKEVIEKQKERKAGTLIYPVGNDLLNFDTPEKTTTKGTSVDSGSNFKETYATVLELEVEALKSLREVYNEIIVMLCEGNHDRNSSFTLYLSLILAFENDEKIKFVQDYKPIQAFQWGKTSLFLNHGDINAKQFAHQISAMFPKIYGETEYRYAICHHKHHEFAKEEINGITFFYLPTLKPTDRWEYNNAYAGSKRQQEIFEFTKEYGLEADFSIKEKMLTKKYIKGK